MSENKIVKTLWIDKRIGEHQLVCLNSFIKNNIMVELYVYNEVENVPEGIILKDANEILDRSYIFKDLFDSYATFSDWFRIKLLHEKGGWWSDADMLMIKPFEMDVPFVFATETDNFNNKGIKMCNCVIKMPEKSEFGKSVLSRIEKVIGSKSSKEIQWTEIGAKILFKEIQDKKMFEYVVKPEVFCPIGYEDYQKIFKGNDFEIDEITYGIHLWNKMWEWSNKSPLKEMEENSLFSFYVK